MAQPSLSDRLARTKRGQARALSGDRAPPPVQAANDAEAGEGVAPTPARQSRDSLLREFENLLPVVARLFGYEDEDSSLVRRYALAPTAAGQTELESCVRQWRIDVVVHDVRGLAEDVSKRAWIQFRQAVMGASVDECGQAWAVDALECPAPRAPAHSAQLDD